MDRMDLGTTVIFLMSIYIIIMVILAILPDWSSL